MPRFIVTCVGLAAVCLFGFAENNQKNPFDVSYAQSGIEWAVFAPSAGAVLTVSGPDGLHWKEEYPPTSRPRFGVVDEQGTPRPEGLYRWELIAQLPPGPGGEVPDETNPVVSGAFLVRGGVIVPQQDEAQPALVEDGAPLRSLFLDREGRLGMGTTVPESQLHLKGRNPALTLEDMTTGGRGYTLRGLEKGDGSLGLFDQATGQPRWLIDGEGRMGINTAAPTCTLTVDGYIEATKGFLVNGQPVGPGFGLLGGSRPLYTESNGNNYFGTNAGGTGGTANSFFGSSAGDVNTGNENAFVGFYAGRLNTGGSYNSFFGGAAGEDNTTGAGNSFFGNMAGRSNAAGMRNSFFGRSAGQFNTASDNSFFGYFSGLSNTTGAENAFFGAQGGYHNTTGSFNSFFGRSAGYSNTTGLYNSYFGNEAGYAGVVAWANSFFGDQAGMHTTGDFNSFFGASAGVSNTTGEYNIAVGVEAGGVNTTGQYNSFLGTYAALHHTIENNNTFVGGYADVGPGTPGSVNNATAIGYRSYVSRANSLVLGGVNGFNSVTAETFVGIGTPSPDRQLVVEGSQALGKFRRFNATGPDFGPAFLFERARGTNIAALDILPGDYLGKVQFRGRVAGSMPEYGALVFIADDTSQNGRFAFVDRDLVTERMTVRNTGNVGIGTNAPTERLDVNGNLRVRGSIVYGAPAVPVPDYVFEPGYKLMPLAELENYVRTERHLPSVPNASQIQEQGVNLGEFQMKLLQKIEELTLYTVEQAKQIHDQQKTIEKLERQQEELTALKAEVDRLKQLIR